MPENAMQTAPAMASRTAWERTARQSRVRRAPLVVLAVLLAAGCGVPKSVPKQADDLESIAAEGALLAGDAADGDSTSPFVATHSEALGKNAETLRKAISDPELGRVADEVIAELQRLAKSPGERAVAAEVERRLDEAAKRIEEIGKAAS
jgi:hypothetical protein